MERKKRNVSYSRVECSRMIHYEDINGFGRLFGGRLMEWMDEVAGLAAIRHSGGFITTAAVDNLQFKKGAYINDIIVLMAHITYVGNTSMEVRIDVYVEDKATGKRVPINRAYFTEVSVDENGRPVPVEYDIEIQTDAERAEYEGAVKRLEIRRQRRLEGF